MYQQSSDDGHNIHSGLMRMQSTVVQMMSGFDLMCSISLACTHTFAGRQLCAV